MPPQSEASVSNTEFKLLLHRALERAKAGEFAPPVRTLDDMTEAEIARLESEYGMTVLPAALRRERQQAALRKAEARQAVASRFNNFGHLSSPR